MILFEKILYYFHQAPKWPLGLLTFIASGNSASIEIFTHSTLEERCLLYRLGLKSPRGCRMLEVGSYLGASACFLAAAARERGGHVWCVDPWTNEAMTEGQRDTYDQFMHNTQKYTGIISPLRMYSAEAAQSLTGLFDLIFIDGSHEYDAVLEDVQLWMPRLAHNGWFVLHDTGWAFGVQRVAKELVLPLVKDDIIELPNMLAARIAK